MGYLACDETITLVQLVENDDQDTYVCTPIQNASWFSKVTVALEYRGVRSADIVKIRIPEEDMPDDVTIRNGDFVVRGTVSATITKQADLAAYDHATVVSVGDNRRGSLRHWVVTGQR